MFRTIIVPIDLDAESSWVKTLPVAVECAKHWQADLHIVTVVPDHWLSMTIVAQVIPEGYKEMLVADAEQRLAKVTESNLPGDIHVWKAVRKGRVYEEILRYARDVQADLIMMASHRPEVSDYLLGSNAAQVVRHADCSVWTIR